MQTVLALNGTCTRAGFVLGLMCLCSACPSLGQERVDEFHALAAPTRDLARQLKDAGSSRIAVVDFVDLSGATVELGRAIAEEVSNLLVREGKPLRVVDRLSLSALLAEHKLTVTGLVDPETAKTLGRISGVEILVTGTITPLADSVRVNLKAMDTATAIMLAASTATLERTTAIDRLLRVESTAGRTRTTGFTGEYEGVEQFKRVGALDMRLVSLQLLQRGAVTVTIGVKNTKAGDVRAAVALKAEGSGGIADYWKFFPRPTAYLTDDLGATYQCNEASGIGMARDGDDFLFVRDSEEVTFTLSCGGGSRGDEASTFKVVVEFWYAEKELRSRTEATTRVMAVSFDGVRPRT